MHLKTIHVVELISHGVQCYAGFGNRMADSKVYDLAKIPKSVSFILCAHSSSIKF